MLRLGMGLRLSDMLRTGAAPSSLLNGLVSYWTLDEASGTRADSVGSNDLTDNNTVGSDTGMNNAAASFVLANTEYLTKTAFVAPDDYTVAAWIRPTAAGIAQGTTHIFEAGTAWANQVQFALAMAGTAIRATISDGTNFLQFDSAASLANGVWASVVLTYTSADRKGRLYLDDGAAVTSDALPGAADRTAATLTMGRYFGGGFYFDGLIDEVAIWSRVVTDDERTERWNAGSGKFYPF